MNEITSAIAVLGVYFAMMAVLAVLVEAVIGWFKIPIPWLQGKPSPSDVLKEVSDWLPEEGNAEKRKAQITALNKALKEIGETPIDPAKDTDLAEIAKRVGEATTKHIKNDRTRRGFIRILAIGLGVGFAFAFQIDTIQLLGPLSEASRDFWVERLTTDGAYLAGLILSGLAASAGSSFWHDQSSRLRQLKKAAEPVGGMTG